MVNKKGNEDIVRQRVEIGQKNKEDVYNAVHTLTSSDRTDSKEKVRLQDIWNRLEEKTKRDNEETKSVMIGYYESERSEWTRAQLSDAIKKQMKRTIHIRTIQRCIDRDSRIKKDGWYFYIDDEARFEKRNLNPSLEGRQSYKEFRRNMSGHYYNELLARKPITRLYRELATPEPRDLLQPPPLPPATEDDMKHLVTEIGFFMVYTLIDACRPFRDRSMDLEEREDLVRYWLQNSIPISTMLDDFLEYFKPDYIHDLYDRHEAKVKKKGLSVLEMDEGTIQSTLAMLEKQFPTEYKIMAESSPEGLKRMSPFAYKDGNLIHPKKVRPR